MSRRRRFWTRAALALAALFVIGRLALPFALRAFAERWAAARDLEVAWRDLDLSLAGGHVVLEGLELTRRGDAPRTSLARLEYVEVDADVSALFRGVLRVHRVELDGLDLEVRRDADGSLELARLFGAGSGEPDEEQDEPVSEDEPLELGLPVRVDSLRAQHVQLWIEDASVDPPSEARVELNLRGRELGSPEGPARIELAVWSPGVCDALRVEARGRSGGARLDADVRVSGRGLRPRALEPWLRPAGVTAAAEELTLDASLEARFAPTDEAGRVAAGSVLASFALHADGEEALALDRAELSVGEWRAAGVGELELSVSGARARARRLASGATRVLGVDVGGPADRRSLAEPESTEGAAELSLDLGRLGVRSLAPGAERSCANLDLEDLALAAGSERVHIARLLARGCFERARGGFELAALELSAPGTVESVALEGRIALVTSPLALDADVALEVSGIAPETLARAGLEPVLDGLGMRVVARVADVDGLLGGEASIEDLAVVSGDERPLSVESLAVRGLALESGGARAEAVEATGAELRWRDASVEPPVELHATLEVRASELDLSPGAPPAMLEARVSVAGSLEQGTLTGPITLERAHPAVALDLVLEGLRAGPLAGWLPPTSLEDGRLALRLEARADALDEGGHAIEVALEDLVLEERSGGATLVSLERASLVAPRVDPGGGRIDVREIETEGFAIEARRTAAGTLEVAGLALALGADSSAPDAIEPAEPSPAEPTPPAEASPPGEVAAAAPPGAAPTTVPVVRLERLAVGVDRLRVVDETRPDEEVVASVKLSLDEPRTVLSPRYEELDPLPLTLEVVVEPVLASLWLSMDASPFAPDPRIDVRMAARGIDLPALEALLPGLDEAIDGETFDDGLLEGAATCMLRARRRGPLDFDLSSGFGLELEVSDVALRAEPEGRVLAGVEAIFADVARIVPSTGAVHVSVLEITRPVGVVRRREDGLWLSGAFVPLETTPSEAEVGDLVAEEDQREGSAPELRIDRVLVSGLDLDLRDVSVDPPVVLPLDDLEVDVRGFTTRALEEPLPLRFRVLVGAAPIELPERELAGRDGLARVGSLLGAAKDVIAGDEEAESELRPAFGQIVLTGRLTLVPEPTGWVRLDVRSFELQNLRGLAAESGVEIGDGVLDSSVEVRLRGAEGMRVDSRSTLGSLSLSEPPGGPISRHLALPAPLDTVLFALRDPQGEHVIPLHFQLDEAGLSVREILQAATRTLAQVIGEAIARSPVRIAGGVLDLTGLFGDDPVELTGEPVVIEFPPMGTALPPGLARRLADMVETLRADESVVAVLEHHFGPADLARAEELANPDEPEVRAIAARLRLEREVLARGREAAFGRALANIDSPEEGAAARDELRAADRELGRVEAALDRTLELLRPGAERRAPRRTRAAAMAVAEQRLEAAREFLGHLPVLAIRTRIDARRARWGAVAAEGPGAVRVILTRR